MKPKMCGLAVALLIFVCFLSSCPDPNPGYPPNLNHGPIAAGGFPPGDPTSTKRGNCVELTGVSGGVPYDYCYYSFSKPMCTTAISECQSSPPSGKCATTTSPPPC
jgi:hypothetical protein